MSKRTNTAQWEAKYNRWRIAVQKDGVRRQFYSSTPGRTGQREANAKADVWLDTGVNPKGDRVEKLFREWYATQKPTTGVAVVLAGMPMGGTTAILAEKYGADSAFASKCTALSTVLSLITTPLWCLVV